MIRLLAWVLFALLLFAPAPGHAATPVRQKMVFAHYMICCPGEGVPPTVAQFEREIVEAQKRGIDGFALNCGGWRASEPRYREWTLLMYEAARQLGTGFKLFISADGGAQSEIEDMVGTFRNHPNQLKLDGKPVLSTFGGEGAKNEEGGPLTARAHRLGAMFVPYYYPRPDITELPNRANAEQILRSFPDIDGWFYFGAAGTGDQISRALSATMPVIRRAGKLAMASATPYYRANGGNFRCFETRGFEGMASEWEAAIASGAQWMELVTWNDWGESTYIAPFGPPDAINIWNSHWGPKLLSHVAYLDASRYYIDWFKRGRRPKIARDRGFYFYRLHPKGIEVSVDPGAPTKGVGRPAGADGLLDDVFVTLFLTAPAELTIESGTQRQVFPVSAGVQHFAMPFSPGKQHFVLRRAGRIVLDKTGEHEISVADASSRFNTFAGAMQQE